MTQENMSPLQPDDEQTGRAQEGSQEGPPVRRKPYEKPAILSSEALESLANACDGGKTDSLPMQLGCQSWINS